MTNSGESAFDTIHVPEKQKLPGKGDLIGGFGKCDYKTCMDITLNACE